MRKKKEKSYFHVIIYMNEKLRIFDDSKIIQNVMKNPYPK